eukprot:SAG25_NODE_786_length_5332_cov_175.941525_9_plen_176_part_00
MYSRITALTDPRWVPHCARSAAAYQPPRINAWRRCWICGRSMTSTSVHYARWNLCGCPGAHMDTGYQYRTGTDLQIYHCRLCAKRIGVVLLLPLAAAAAVVTLALLAAVAAVVLPSFLVVYPFWATVKVSAAFPPFTRFVLAEIYLCHACSGHAIERASTRHARARGGRGSRPAR